MRALPDDTRLVLLLAAADQYPVATHAFLRAVAAGASTPGRWRPPRRPESPTPRRAGSVFRDPWTRIAAYETASVTDRRDVHLLLARVLRGEGESPRRSWHRGAAALGPSRRLAAELQGGRQPRPHRGRPALACALAERAAGAVPRAARTARLLARAAADAWRSGDADRARRLAARTDADALGGVLALRAGNAAEAFDALLTPRRASAAGPPTRRVPSSPAPPKPPSTPATCGAAGRRWPAARPARASRRPACWAGLAAAVEGRYEDAAGPAEGDRRPVRPGGDPTLLVTPASPP